MRAAQSRDGMEGGAARRPPAPDIRRIAVPAYLVAAVLVLFPLADTALSVLPLQPRNVPWRYGTVGLFSRVLATPLLGLLIACGVAVLLEHRRWLRVLAASAGTAAVVLFAVSALFVLDAVQLRTQVQPEAQTAVEVASVAVLAKLGIAGLVALAFAVAGWRASRLSARARRGRGPSVAAATARTPEGPVAPSSTATPLAG